jgi:NADP-dependent 3-hydroxy acid dehydrogenase YdfG
MSKVILITGASSGIGAATARRLAEAGHLIVAGARRTDRLAELGDEVRATGGVLNAYPLDVTDLGSVRAFAAAALDRHGRIDVLVNNAGVMPLSPIAELRIDEWEQMIDVNLRGTLYGIAAVLPHFRERGSGHIVNVSSVSTAVHPTRRGRRGRRPDNWRFRRRRSPTRSRSPLLNHPLWTSMS